MTLQQTVTIPADRRLHLDWTLPETASPGAAQVVLIITRIDDECPEPEVRQDTPNAVTIAAMQEARDILSGKIQTKRYSSLAEFDAEIAAEIAAEDAITRC
ncbi:MAG: hypothetical protein LBS97_04885 [Treponema sp.]|jgi:hypothetical protein|nr:hypothetical protein [Treponema sp.]